MQKRFFLNKKDCIFFALLFIIIVFLIIIVCIKKEDVHICINDNLDSNVSIFKMIRDQGLFLKFDEEIPFLHGDILRKEYHIGLSLEAWIYMLFPPFVAYIVIRLIALIMSAFGFWILAKSMESIFQVDSLAFGLCGIIYGLLGTWPHASLGFASIPLWVSCLFYLYCTRDKKILIVFPFFLTTISFPLIGIWLLAYSSIVIVIIIAIRRRFDMIIPLAEIGLCYGIMNYGLILSNLGNNETSIKGLIDSKYSDTIIDSIKAFPKTFSFYHFYHTGGAVLRYFVFPICICFMLFCCCNLIYKLFKRENSRYSRESIVSAIIFGIIIFNTLLASFDNNYILRKYVLNFMKGFALSRIHWISPFLWMVLLALCMSLLNDINFLQKIHTENIKKSVSKYLCSFAIFIVVLCTIVLDPSYSQLYSMYNDIHFLLADLFSSQNQYDGNHEFTWFEWYSEDLFNKIKQDISYKGEWSMGYGIDPSVLQYNGINTADGYYSNYSIDFYNKFYELIKPELAIDELHNSYWNNTGGYRACLYSTEWDFWPRYNFETRNCELIVNKEMLHDMTSYIFSRVIITNSNDLGLELLGHWSGYESPYDVYVYGVCCDISN